MILSILCAVRCRRAVRSVRSASQLGQRAFDSGDGSGFVIRRVLEPGIYFLRVEGQAGATGTYRPVMAIAPVE